MDGDWIVAALERHVFQPDETVAVRRDGLVLHTQYYLYQARRPDWLVAGEPWVEDAVRVSMGAMFDHVPLSTFGLLLGRDRAVWFLNEAATMRALGRRLSEDLDALAYAELLAEFYSGPNIEKPVVYASAMTESMPAGSLIRDVAATVAQYPFLDPGILTPPVVRQTDTEVHMEFRSLRYYRISGAAAVDVLRWSVTGGGGRDASWSREYVAKGIQQP